MMTEEQVSELQIRSWRDIVFGRPSTDDNWFYCKDHWMQPQAINWLQEQVKKNEKEKEHR